MKTITHKFKKACAIGVTIFALAGTAYADQPINAYLGYVNLGNLPAGSNQINPMRLQALRETATQLGATGALAWRSVQIDATLQKEANYLDRVFDFNRLLINNDVLPPVLVEGDNSLNLDGNDTIRLASKIYKIVSPARFVTTPPNWREYLWMDYQKPTMPDHTLLPQTQAEAQVWNAYLKQGWTQGIDQANAIFQTNLNRLKRDYQGIILYRELLAQNMVSAPYVAKSDLGVTGNAKEMRIGDQVLRITSHAELQTDSKKWMPIVENQGK